MLYDLVPGEVLRIEDQDCPIVPAVAAVVARAEDRDAAPLVLLHVASTVLRNLMASDHEPQPVLHAELGGDVLAELDADASLRLELAGGLGGVAPDEVGEDLVLDVRSHRVRRRDLCVVDRVDVVDRHRRDPRQAAMDDEDLLLDDAAQGQGLKGTDEAAVRHEAVLAHDLVYEAAAGVGIQGVHVLILVVPAMYDHALRIG
mmetsp:Transcript_66071/g.166596  ORF Transcript_66071/g.166596 Transcript_66071/m.166596 type:complete len:202 (-) Transcript_66071:858-1463(-)